MAKQNFRQLNIPGMELEDIADENINSNPVSNTSNSRHPKKRKGLRLMIYGLIGAMTLGVGYGSYVCYDIKKNGNPFEAGKVFNPDRIMDKSEDYSWKFVYGDSDSTKKESSKKK